MQHSPVHTSLGVLSGAVGVQWGHRNLEGQSFEGDGLLEGEGLVEGDGLPERHAQPRLEAVERVLEQRAACLFETGFFTCLHRFGPRAKRVTASTDTMRNLSTERNKSSTALTRSICFIHFGPLDFGGRVFVGAAWKVS